MHGRACRIKDAQSNKVWDKISGEQYGQMAHNQESY